jgi:hypothetical protein
MGTYPSIVWVFNTLDVLAAAAVAGRLSRFCHPQTQTSALDPRQFGYPTSTSCGLETRSGKLPGNSIEVFQMLSSV